MATNLTSIIQHLLNTSDFKASLPDVKQCAQSLKLQPKYPIILIGGTNGKGSTCAYLATILALAGYRVGSFTSPHVFSYTERISINNQPIAADILASALEQVQQHSTSNLGLFKTFTLASHLIFTQQQIDIAIIEVGIGGGDDATNLFTPTIAAITGVALDHQNILGKTIEEIAQHKVTIFRDHQPAFFGASPVPQAILNYAHQHNCDLYVATQDFGFVRKEYGWDFYCRESRYFGLPYPSLRGTEQLANASLALAILARVQDQFPLTVAQIKHGLLQTSLVGRFQVLPGQPQVVLDTAHNPQAVEQMCQNMLKLPFAKKNVAVFAVAEDKDWRTILSSCSKHFDYWCLSSLPSNRSSDPKQLAEFLQQQGVAARNIQIYPTLKICTQTAYQQLTPTDRVVCFGSFMVVEQAYHAINEVRK